LDKFAIFLPSSYEYLIYTLQTRIGSGACQQVEALGWLRKVILGFGAGTGYSGSDLSDGCNAPPIESFAAIGEHRL
jgi:hypothetical protein